MKFPKIALAIAALAGVVSLAACQATGYTGPTDAPKVTGVTTKDPTSDLSNNWRRSITLDTGADIFDTWYNADALSNSNGGQMFVITFSKAWYDQIAVPSGDTRATAAAKWVAVFTPESGPVTRLCNYMFIDGAIPTAGRSAMYQAIADQGRYEAGAEWIGYGFGDDPVNEIEAKASACYSEGV